MKRLILIALIALVPACAFETAAPGDALEPEPTCEEQRLACKAECPTAGCQQGCNAAADRCESEQPR